MRKILWCSTSLILCAVASAALSAQERPVSYSIDAARSEIHVVTHRTGFFSFLGHDHAILATQWTGSVCFAPARPQESSAAIDVATRGLVIDTDSARGIARLGKGPSPSQVRDLQAKILDAQHLDAASFPAMTLQVQKVTSAQPSTLRARGQLMIRGRAREVEFPVMMAASNDTMRFRGVLSVPQSGFGIKPESVAGVVKVADVVDLHFDLFATPTRLPCSK